MRGGTLNSVFETLFDEVVIVPVNKMVVKGKSTKQSTSKATKLPTRSPTTKPNFGIIYMAISANISVSIMTAAGQGQRNRQHLIVTKKDTTTIMTNTIQDVVKSSLNANQSLLVVIIMGIKEFFII
jgi:hypothetical protein